MQPKRHDAFRDDSGVRTHARDAAVCAPKTLLFLLLPL